LISTIPAFNKNTASLQAVFFYADFCMASLEGLKITPTSSVEALPGGPLLNLNSDLPVMGS